MSSPEVPWTDALFPFFVSEDEKIEALRSAFTALETLVVDLGLVVATYTLVRAIGPQYPEVVHWISTNVTDPAVMIVSLAGAAGTVFHGWMAHPRG